MKRVYLALFLLFFVSSVSYAQEQKSSDSYIKDFGKILAGEIARHSFTIKNETKKVLNIKSVNTSCGCTVSEVKHKRLNPGEETSLEVKFNSKGYSGPVQQFVYVDTDNLDNPILRFIIKANVVK